MYHLSNSVVGGGEAAVKHDEEGKTVIVVKTPLWQQIAIVAGLFASLATVHMWVNSRRKK